MSVPRLTREQAAIVGAFTQIACGPFSDVHEYAEKIMGRPCSTHEFGSQAFVEILREKARKDFLSICADTEGGE